MARLLVMVAVTTAGLGVAATILLATAPGSRGTSTDFMNVPPAQQGREIAALSPEDRAASMKQHLERWLEVHRPDLSTNAQALVREAIDFATPELYSRAPTEAERQRQFQLGQRLACSLGDARASTLMQRHQPPQRISQSWSERTREWIDWAVNCAGR
jgi:hypothetical protein